MSNYLKFSRTPYYAVVASLPLLIIYELLLTLDGSTVQGQVRNAADVWLRMVLVSLGLSPAHATLAMIFVLILAIPLLRSRSEPLQAGFFGWMFLESLVYGFFLGIAINYILAFMFSFFLPAQGQLAMGAVQAVSYPSLAMPANTGLMQGLALSLGAGLFEEFFFRVILLNGLLYMARIVFSGWLAAFFAIGIAAFLFSVAHYIGPLGEPLELHSFLFRWVAGLLFSLLFYVRGFAVVAYSHAFYDIWVITGLFRIVGW